MALLINDVVRAPVCDFEPAGAVETGVGTLEKREGHGRAREPPGRGPPAPIAWRGKQWSG